jgi:transglutaminase-like putative cysteine protease
MPILSIRHVTTYHYKQPVAFGEHRMMLRPRDDDDQKVIETNLEITPRPKQLAWTRDSLASFALSVLFVSNMLLPAFAQLI